MRGELKSNHSLARYTSWRVGGPARQFYHPADLEDLVDFLKQLPKAEPLFWLGLGSNVLIPDGGINGTVILTKGCLDRLEGLDDHTFRAECGVTCAKAAKYCVQHGLAKGAFFSGIPGTIGGALAMNAGAFGGTTWDYVRAVETIDLTGRLRTRAPSDFRVAYREVKGPPEEWFVAGHFRFPQGDVARAAQELRALLSKRNQTQPIGERSCGSVFRNPPGDHAARLIEVCGLKGTCIGGAHISEKHANFIINDGTATAADILQLIELIEERVRADHGIELVREVRVL